MVYNRNNIRTAEMEGKEGKLLSNVIEQAGES